MTDTLRSIAEGMEHGKETGAQILRERPAEYGEWLKKALKVGVSCRKDCNKCRLEALLAKYERVDLVKQWKQVANDMRVAATRERAYAERFYDERAEHLRNARDFDDTANLYDACTAQLETWLAVNLERIKAEARQDGEASAYKSAIALLHSFSSHADRGEVLGILRGLQDMSEGKTRTLEEVRAALEAQAKEKP